MRVAPKADLSSEDRTALEHQARGRSLPARLVSTLVSSFSRPMDFRTAKSLLNSASHRKRRRGGASGFWRAEQKPLPKTHLDRAAVERSRTVRWRRLSS